VLQQAVQQGQLSVVGVFKLTDLLDRLAVMAEIVVAVGRVAVGVQLENGGGEGVCN